MSKITIVIVIIVLAILGWMYWGGSGQDQALTSAGVVTQVTATPVANQNTSKVSASDTSDAALDADLKAVDGNMTDLNADGASVDAGLKDQSTY